jgi:hypothetical protein
MTSSHPGARVIFSRGSAHLAPALPAPAGWVPAQGSVISPGTELRHLAATVTGPDRAAGYMTLTRPVNGSGALLAPVPHGAATSPDDARALRVPAGVAVEHVAVARFQLMAALGLARCRPLLDRAARVLVMGSGPVAVGCVLELHRIGVPLIRVATRHPAPAVARLPGVTVSCGALPAAERVVIDCTGRSGQGLRAAAPGGMLGLLGTPAEDSELPAAMMHRSGVTVVGMHELACFEQAAYQEMFLTVLADVRAGADAGKLRLWYRVVPGEQAPRLYQELKGPRRPAEPFLLLDWAS